MLSVKDLIVHIDGSTILRRVSLEVGAGELVCLVGRNGAGKSTTFRTIMGARRPASGTIALEVHNLLLLAPFEIARLGIGFAPEESEVFGDLTVAENILLPTWTRPTSRPAALGRRAQDGIDCSRAGTRPEVAAARRARRRALPSRRARDHRRHCL